MENYIFRIPTFNLGTRTISPKTGGLEKTKNKKIFFKVSRGAKYFI